MVDWRKARLGEVATDVTVGFVGSMAAEYTDSGIVFLRSQNITPHRIDFSDTKYIGDEFHQRLAKSALRPGDVVTVRTGKPGTSAVVPQDAPEMNCADLVITRPGPSLDSRWLSYYLNSVTEGFIATHLVGAVQQHFNVGIAKAMELSLPPLAEQQAIAEVLGALDDKIAANTSASNMALELARALFARAVGSTTPGPLTFDDLCEIGGGGTPRTGVPEYWDGEIPWATPTDITALPGPYINATARAISASGLEACSSPLYPSGSILMTSRATIGAFAVTDRPMAVNQGFIVVRTTDPGMTWWIFHDMHSRVDEFISQANGATFLELSRGKFRTFGVRLTDTATMDAFGMEAGALHASARELLVENRGLSTLRDTLLPHLMSGRLRVKDAEKQVEAVL